MNKILILLHIIGATVWVGGHLLLLLRYVPDALKQKDPEIIRSFEKKYEAIGLPALLLQLVTGVALGWIYQLHWFRFTSHADTVFNLKLILLLATILLAIHARFFLIPKLTAGNLGKLAAHIFLVTILALGFIYLGVSYRYGF